MTNKPRTANPRRVDERVRSAQAVVLRRDGLPLRQIAERLGYHDASTAYRAIVRTLDRTDTEVAAGYRQLMTERYEDLYRRNILALDNARDSGRAQLIGSARAVLDSLCRLHRLDTAPSDQVAEAPTVDDLDREIAGLAAALTTYAKTKAAECGLDAPATPILDCFAEYGKQ